MSEKGDLNLLRMTFDRDGCEIDQHTSDSLVCYGRDWMCSVKPVPQKHVGTWRNTFQQIVDRPIPNVITGNWHDLVSSPDSRVRIDRYCRCDADRIPKQVDLVVSLEGYLLSASLFGRVPGEAVDLEEVTRKLLALKLHPNPDSDREVPPAWLAYQKSPIPEGPRGKFWIYMDPTPVFLSDTNAFDIDVDNPDMDVIDAPPGQVLPHLVKFHVLEGDPTSIRVDVWVDRDPPQSVERKSVFEGSLRLRREELIITAFDQYQLPMSPGDYDVSISVTNLGHYHEMHRPVRRIFDDENIERYEVVLTSKQATARND